MILTIVFVLVLLTGVSLLIAVAGTSMLRRNSRPVRPSSYSIADRGVYDGYAERAQASRGPDVERVEPAWGGPRPYAPPPRGYTPIEPSSFGPPPLEPAEFDIRAYGGPAVRSTGAESKWFAVSIVTMVVLFFTVFFGVRIYQTVSSRPRIDFCEYVDFVDLKPVNASDTFTRGNVTVFLRSRAPLELDKVRVEVYRIDREGIVPYTTRDMQLKPEWTSFQIKVVFEELGNYTVMIYTGAGVLLGQKTIAIVPDEFAYTPVPG